MRKVAPDSPGSAASQNSWSVLKAKPMAFRRTITVLHTIHTAKARNSAGIEIHRLRVAMALPTEPQKCGSSGRQSSITGPCRGGCPIAGFLVADMLSLLQASGSGTHGARGDRKSVV